MSATTVPPFEYTRPNGRRASSLLRGLWRGQDRDPAWARPALLCLLAATAVAYLFNLSRNGYANDFYAAAVQAGTRSWKAFFFGSFDASNFITVDKTPASLWVDELFARAFGFSSWTLLAPQALEGVASVAILYAAVRRWFGPSAGLSSRSATTGSAVLTARRPARSASTAARSAGAAPARTSAVLISAVLISAVLISAVLISAVLISAVLISAGPPGYCGCSSRSSAARSAGSFRRR
jgi:hypothetical protein